MSKQEIFDNLGNDVNIAVGKNNMIKGKLIGLREENGQLSCLVSIRRSVSIAKRKIKKLRNELEK
jgi:hypothetical protein